ncbi:MAG: triose-phosphate isomerase [Candidatus Dadabacteria bacterium]|nr:triose-phosphate isomerase [Candidatus Dadabacteria bacterium]NIQ15141.1 triose-phosphate isomerase [Candidatus Dadabacteria bacterium]
MPKKLIIGNWKMNLIREESKLLSSSILNILGDNYDKCEVVLIPPYTSIETVYNCIKDSNTGIGAQDVSSELFGAFTGEISVSMLKDLGCEWVIIGHSERRHIIGETYEDIRKKTNTALEGGLNVILCVGETEEQRDQDIQISVINKQLESALSGVNKNYLSNIVIAYEPVWAIGTGKNAEPEDIIVIHSEIKKILTGLFGNDGNNIRILYGGSVTPDNIVSIISNEFVDGALVGGASLKSDSFTKIIMLAGV